jgi:hypothetical protein
MKKLLIVAAATLVSVGAFAQGKLLFDVNSDNLIYFTTDTTKLIGADKNATADNGYGAGALPLAGSTLYTGQGLNSTPGTIQTQVGAPSGFTVALYGGASSSSLTLQTTTTIADVSNPGGIVSVATTLGLPAGTPAWFQEEVYDSRNTSAPTAWAAGHYAGEGVLFQATPQVSVYSPVFQVAAPVSSTLAPGTVVPTDLAQLGGGYFGGIAVYASPVPEPGTFALAGLGLAALLVFRRRS